MSYPDRPTQAELDAMNIEYYQRLTARLEAEIASNTKKLEAAEELADAIENKHGQLAPKFLSDEAQRWLLLARIIQGKE